MSYINIIKRSYPLVLITCDALTVEPLKIFPEHWFLWVQPTVKNSCMTYMKKVMTTKIRNVLGRLKLSLRRATKLTGLFRKDGVYS
jgi:hypothetical protein